MFSEINSRSIIAEFVASGTAIIPTFYGFQVKTALQTGAARPPFNLYSALAVGARKAPFVGFMIGTQRILQNATDKVIERKFNTEKNVVTSIASATIIGTITTPLVAIFTGMTNEKSISASIKALTWKQMGASAWIENGFLMGMGITEPVIAKLQRRFGKHKVVDYIGAFGSGALGAAAGHAGDSALTFWQNNIKITNLFQLKKGMVVRSVAVGGYNCIYKFAIDNFPKR